MRKRKIFSKSKYILLSVLMCSTLFIGCEKKDTNNVTKTKEDIIILYTSDVHCGIEEDIGYAGLASYKEAVMEKTPYVTLVDCGDAIQGEYIGMASSGEYIVDIMNEVGYDFAILGNHEFDYGMGQLEKLISKSNAQYLSCNITYTGKNENALTQVKPYEIVEYGDTKIAYIGIATPETTTKTTPTYFMEDGEFVYDFAGGSGEEFYGVIQKYIDECKKNEADYIILLSHLGDAPESAPFNSTELIGAVEGVDVLLDAHSHSTVSCRVLKDKAGEEVLVSSTGTKLNNIGQVVITGDGNISTGLIDFYDAKDEEIGKFIGDIKSEYEEEMEKKVAYSDISLKCANEDGIRLVRNRETAIGNFCADAYRVVADADIGMVNGGGVRADLLEGDITYADLTAVHPFGNTLCMAKVSGQEIADILEIGAVNTMNVEVKDDQAAGENGSFMSVSGLKYTVDTSVESSVIFDENGMFIEVKGDRRVKDIMIMNDEGEYEPIDLKGEYTLASHNYLLKEQGSGATFFDDNEFIIDEGMTDYQMLILYLTEYLNGDLASKYSDVEGRITIE